MPSYRRAHAPGGTFCFTLVTESRAPIFESEHARRLLHDAIAECAKRRPFVLDAIVLLPDHGHMLMTLPEGDGGYSMRLAAIKATFTRSYLAGGGVEQVRSAARVAKRRRGVWQRWFWEHLIRDQDDFNAHLNYIHYNPVKHGLAKCPHAWTFSSFHRWVERGGYAADWQCTCNGQPNVPPRFDSLAVERME